MDVTTVKYELAGRQTDRPTDKHLKTKSMEKGSVKNNERDENRKSVWDNRTNWTGLMARLDKSNLQPLPCKGTNVMLET